MAASDDSDDKECPLCMEPLELDDINFYPCTCEYQICRFCWHRIRTDENGLCPACRKPYPENPVNFKPLSQDELKKIAQEKKQKEFQRKQKVSESRKHLTNIRVVQKNLVFVVGLAARLADAEILKRNEYFGKFGRIQKVMVNNQSSYVGQQGPSASAYVTYFKAEDALRCIQCVNNLQFDGRTMKACLGTTKYCSMFLKNQSCSKQDCMYLHELGDEAASFTKEEMQQGKHTEYERKLIDQILSMLPSQDHRRPGSVSPSSLAWSDDRLRKAERDDNGSFSDESINAITGVGGVQRSSSNNKVNCSYVSGGKNENVAAGLRPFNEHTTAQRKRYKAFRSRSPGAKQQIHHHHHSSAAPGSNKERTFVSNGGGGVGGGISNIPPRLQYLHGQGAGGGAGYCRTHHSGCGNGGRSLVKTRGRRRENNRFLDDEFLTSAAKETTRSASADATSRHSTSTSNSQSPSPVPPQVSNDEKASAVVDAGGNLDDLTVVDIGAAGRLSKGAGGAGGLMVMTGSNKAADKQQFGSSFGCQNEPTSTSTAGVVMQTSLSTSSLSSLPIVATDLVENQLMAAFQSSLANCKTLDATGLVEDLSQVNFPTQCSNYDSVAGQSSSSYSWQNNSQNNRAATSSVVDWQAVFGFNGSTETPINAISALLQPANTPQLPPHHTAGAVLKERNCGAEQSVPVNIVNGFGAGADSDNINMSPSQNVQQQQQRFPSGDLPSTSSLRNFSVDDDLGFDPFAESSKGLEDMLRMEQQQQQASQSESSRTLGGGAHQFANMFNSSKSAAISSNHDFHKHSLPFFHHHPGGQHHPGCQPHPGGAISSSFPTSTMSQQQMQHPAMHNRLSATAGQMSVPGTNGTMVNNMKFNAMRFPPNGISSPPGENMLSEFASHSEKGSRFQTDFPVGMQQPMFGSGWSGNAGSNGLMSPQPPYAARPNHLSMSSGSSQQSPHCGSLQSGTPKEQSLSFKEWQDGLRQLFPSVNVQFAPNLKPQGLQPSNVDGCMPSATNLASPGGIPPKNVPGPQMRSGFPPPSLHRGMMRFPPPPIPGGMPPMPPSSGSPFVNRHLHFGPNQSQNGMRPHWKESQLRGQTVTMAQDTPDWSLLPIPPPGFSSL